MEASSPLKLHINLQVSHSVFAKPCPFGAIQLNLQDFDLKSTKNNTLPTHLVSLRTMSHKVYKDL